MWKICGKFYLFYIYLKKTQLSYRKDSLAVSSYVFSQSKPYFFLVQKIKDTLAVKGKKINRKNLKI